MSRKKIYAVLIPTVTFVLGILVQVLLSKRITSINVIPISLVVIMVILIVFALILELIDSKLAEIVDRIGLDMYYIEDGTEGKSYKRSAELVEAAKSSLICVGHWELFLDYKANKTNLKEGGSKIAQARQKFYNAIKRKIEQHRNDELPFHHRIVQVPEEYITRHIPFDTDPVFFDYLVFMAKTINSNSHVCSLKITTSFIQIPFVLIDEEYIIIPILNNIKHIQQVRHGALIIHDAHHRFARRLISMYWELEKRSESIKLSDLETA